MIDPQEADGLAIRARRGDPEALARLYRDFAPPLLAYLRRLTGDHATADDVLHDVFVQLMDSSGPFRARGRFRQWLFSVAANAARDQMRRQRNQTRLADTLANSSSSQLAASPDEDLAAREMVRLVEAALDDLPAEYAAAFHLRVREEFSYREMAAITGDPEGTLRSRVHHTLQRLRDHLAAAEARSDSRTGRENS